MSKSKCITLIALTIMAINFQGIAKETTIDEDLSSMGSKFAASRKKFTKDQTLGSNHYSKVFEYSDTERPREGSFKEFINFFESNKSLQNTGIDVEDSISRSASKKFKEKKSKYRKTVIKRNNDADPKELIRSKTRKLFLKKVNEYIDRIISSSQEDIEYKGKLSNKNIDALNNLSDYELKILLPKLEIKGLSWKMLQAYSYGGSIELNNLPSSKDDNIKVICFANCDAYNTSDMI